MRSLLMIKIGAIGDVVMALPLAVEAKRQHPGASITWVVGLAAAPLLRELKSSGCIDHVVEVDERRLSPWVILRTWVMCLNTPAPRFDHVIVGNPSPWYLAFALPWIFTARVRRFKPSRHDNHPRAYVRMLGSDRVEWPSLPSQRDFAFDRAADLPRPWVAVFPGAARNHLRDDPHRRWPVENYADLVQKLLKEGATVFVLGGPSDTWVRNAFVSICDHPRMVDWIGRHSLVETIQVLSSMDRVVSHDTGPMHLAQWVSQEKPLTLVALFGPTVPETRLLTSNPRIRSIWGGEHLVCRPCYDGRAFPPCDHVSCMRSIKVDAVVQALDL